MDILYHGHTLEYWKNNAEEDYAKVPISVLRYITVLEEAVKDSFSREEVVDLINKFERDTCPDRFEGYGTEQEDIDKFIEQNL